MTGGHRSSINRTRKFIQKLELNPTRAIVNLLKEFIYAVWLVTLGLLGMI